MCAAATGWRLSEVELANCPSLLEGMSLIEYEAAKRRGTELITQAGKRLCRRADAAAATGAGSVVAAAASVPSTALATGAGLDVISLALLFFQRFFSRRSVRVHEPALYGAACLLLAAKVEENYLSAMRLPRVVEELHRFRAGGGAPPGAPPPAPLLTTAAQFAAEEELICAERALLTALEYDFEAPLPWPHLQPAARALGLPEAVEAQAVSLVANHMLRSTLPLQYSAIELAHAALWSARGTAGIPVTSLPGFFDVVTTPVPTMEEIKAKLKAFVLLPREPLPPPPPQVQDSSMPSAPSLPMLVAHQ